MALKCLKCGHDHAVKNGFIFGRQRYKCKRCGYQYTKIKPNGHTDHEKRVVALFCRKKKNVYIAKKNIKKRYSDEKYIKIEVYDPPGEDY